MSQNTNKSSHGMTKKLLMGMALLATETQAIWIVKNGEATFQSEVPDLQKHVNDISRTLPVWDDLGRRKHVMEEVLNPKLQAISADLDSLSDMTDMEAAKIGGETIKKVSNVADTPFIGHDTKEFVIDKIRMEGNNELEAIYQKKFAMDYINAMPTAKTISQIVSPLSIPQFQPNLDPHPHTYVENGSHIPLGAVSGIYNPIADAGPLFSLSESNKKEKSVQNQSVAQTEQKDSKKEETSSDVHQDAMSLGEGRHISVTEAAVDRALTPSKTVIEHHSTDDSSITSTTSEPYLTKLTDPAMILPITSVHTRYQIANDMTGGRIEAMPLAIQQGTAASTENVVGQLAPTGGLEQRILHGKAAYHTGPMKDWRHEATRAMDDYYTTKYAEEHKPKVRVEYSKGPVIFRTPALAEAEKDDMAQSIRDKVDDLNEKEENQKQGKLMKERNIIQDALENYLPKSSD